MKYLNKWRLIFADYNLKNSKLRRLIRKLEKDNKNLILCFLCVRRTRRLRQRGGAGK